VKKNAHLKMCVISLVLVVSATLLGKDEVEFSSPVW
jgi:hypothetical protein